MTNKMSVEEIKELWHETKVLGTTANSLDMLANICRLIDTALALYDEKDRWRAVNDSLVYENQNLRAENERLKIIETKYNREVHVTYGDGTAMGVDSMEALKADNSRLRQQNETIELAMIELTNLNMRLEQDIARLSRYERAWKMITEQGLMAKSDEDIVIRYAGIEEDA